MVKNKLYIFLLLFELSTHIALCQNVKTFYPQIGKPIHNYKFNKIYYTKLPKYSLAAFKGKPLIIDFFSAGCTACFKSFPEINKLSTRYSGRMNYLLVGFLDKTIKASYEKYQKKYDLHMTVTYDSVIFRKFKITGVPHVIWIDSSGIIQAVTGSQEVTKKNIDLFIDGKHFDFIDYSVDGYQKIQNSFNETKPMLMNDNGGVDSEYLYRSIISHFNIHFRQYVISDINTMITNELPLQIIGIDLKWLYRFAFWGFGEWQTFDTVHYGKYSYRPYYELQDTTVFDYDFPTGKNVFCYSQLYKGKNPDKEQMLANMRDDLMNYFQHSVVVEKREMPYLKLAVYNTDSIRRSVEDTVSGSFSFSGLSYKGIYVKDILCITQHFLSTDLPIIDETKIAYRININLEATMTDLESLQSELKKNGFFIILSKKEMQTIVIRGKQNL